MKGDRGSMTIWMLGLSVLLLLFGGLAIDFWRALALQRELSAVADSAAVAAASGIDEVRYRESGEVVLDPERARALGVASITDQDVNPVSYDVSTDGAGLSVSVVVVDTVELGLLGLLVDQTEPLTVRAEATASPRLLP
jgi:Flp pilus assembly protein TadG